MKLTTFDPGTNMTGFAQVTVTGGGRVPVRVTFVAAGNVPSLPSALWPLMKGADVVGVEKLEGVVFAGKAGIVASLIASAHVAGIISGLACARGLRVVEMSARQWRGAVCRKPNASDAVVKNVVHRLVEGIPVRSNVHQRDALGLAVGIAWAIGGDSVQRTLGSLVQSKGAA